MPWWELPAIGGRDSLRGYWEGRFRGRRSVIANGEFRYHIIDIPLRFWIVDVKLVIDGSFFADAGRVFTADDMENSYLSGSRDLNDVEWGLGNDTAKAWHFYLNGYEQVRDFDRRELALIEPLRTLRLIHYSAWLARRWEDPIFPINFPWFGTSDYWRGQVDMLHEQIEAMQEEPLVA